VWITGDTMPELPDVENFRLYFQKTSLNQKINSVQVKELRFLTEIDQFSLQRLLTENRFSETFRHGKNLLVRIGTDPWLTVHFGMTGYIKYYSDISQEPPFDRLLINFSNGNHLSFSDQRIFGRVGVTSSPEQFIKEHHLGPDALQIDEKRFLELFSRKKRALKTLLMDQTFMAGIGNEYSDEILFRAGFLPGRNSSTLDIEELKKLFRSVKEVIHTALKAHAVKKLFPDDYLLKNRRKGSRCFRCNAVMQTLRFGGRTAYYCPGCQR